MSKKLFFILLFGFLAFIAVGLINQIYQSITAASRLDLEIEELSQLQSRNSYLKSELERVNSLQFIEYQARDKLNLAKPGETVVIISEDEIKRILTQNQPPVEVNKPNWQKWLELLK